MAKLGEGDARWIVSDRKDGTNVHNWHWAEKDVTTWARCRLQELLGNLEISNGGSIELVASTSEEVTVTGEAVVNNRKNKLIPAYELEVKGVWSGEFKITSGKVEKVSGQWKIPYLAEENADEDPDLLLSTSGETAADRKAKAIILGAGRTAILEKVRQFVKEISSGGPISEDGKVRGSVPDHTLAKPIKAVEASQTGRPKTVSSSGKWRTYRSTEKFYARATDIYECFTSAERIQAFTQSPAKVVPKEGGEFEIFGGSVVGKFTQLSPDRQIVLDWRFRNWQDQDVSKVDIRLEEPEPGTTVLTLEQSRIPVEDRFGNEDVFETTANGWRQQIFHKIRAVFGFGLGL